jgi:cysteine desulfurase family protein
MEHNSVMRPVESLKRAGVKVDLAPCSSQGLLEPGAVMQLVRPETRLIAVIHASNVVGTINPVAEVGRRARQAGIPLLVDAAQTAGSLPIDVEADCIDILTCSGHKGLMAPQGTGLLYLREGIELETLLEGGTGSYSESPTQPSTLPDRYESGTLNTPGIVALGAGVDYILDVGVEKIREKEIRLTARLLEGLQGMDAVEIYGPLNAEERMPVVSFNIKGMDPASVGQRLDDEYGIMTRVGLHCSPLAHKTLGTFPQGAVRVSMGYFNSGQEVDHLLGSLKKLMEG